MAQPTSDQSSLTEGPMRTPQFGVDSREPERFASQQAIVVRQPRTQETLSLMDILGLLLAKTLTIEQKVRLTETIIDGPPPAIPSIVSEICGEYTRTILNAVQEAENDYRSKTKDTPICASLFAARTRTSLHSTLRQQWTRPLDPRPCHCCSRSRSR